jgi:hypothetical protein
MTVTGTALQPLPLHIGSAGRFGVGQLLTMDGISGGGAAWPAANRAIYVPIVLPQPALLARFMVAGNSTTGNDDVGIYTQSGSLIISTGSVACAASLQYHNVTDTPLGPGRYYLALSHNNTGSHVRTGGSTLLPMVRMAGVLQETSAFGLPSTMTPEAAASVYVPLFGFTQSASF